MYTTPLVQCVSWVRAYFATQERKRHNSKDFSDLQIATNITNVACRVRAQELLLSCDSIAVKDVSEALVRWYFTLDQLVESAWRTEVTAVTLQHAVNDARALAVSKDSTLPPVSASFNHLSTPLGTNTVLTVVSSDTHWFVDWCLSSVTIASLD